MRQQYECSSVENDSVRLCEVVAFFPVWFHFTQKHEWIFTHITNESFRRCTCFRLVVNDVSLSGGYKSFGMYNCFYLQGRLCVKTQLTTSRIFMTMKKIRFFFLLLLLQILMRCDIWNNFYTRFIPRQFDSRQWPLRTVF